MNRGAFALPKYYGTNISFAREPKSALEYLMSVRHEAENMPDYEAVDKDVLQLEDCKGVDVGDTKTNGRSNRNRYK